MINYKIKDLNLAAVGEDSIYLAESRMPTLLWIRKIFESEKPFEGITIGACLHVTRETAVLIRTLKVGGAKVILCGSNPLSTQDDISAVLVKEGFSVYAWRGNESEYYDCIRKVLDQEPEILIDDGADLIVTAHEEKREFLKKVKGAQEETTTGVKRLELMEKNNILKIPVVAVNDAKVKVMFDNRYGTGQGILSALKTLNILFSGKNVVIAGYGWCSKGMARRAVGLGSNVIVTEVEPIKALEAVMDGYRVMPMKEAIKDADMIFTSTGCKDIITKEHFIKMKDKTILANLGHFDVEISVKDLEKISVKKRRIREYTDEYLLPNGNRLYLLAEGRLANLVILGGHPSEVMDLSFSVQALTAKYLSNKKEKLEKRVYKVPEEIDQMVAKLKLKTMNIKIDTLTKKQKSYLNSFKIGT